jgi:hypothetical protein
MALRTGQIGPASTVELSLVWGRNVLTETTKTLGVGGAILPSAMNCRLRTGADKGNPTV